MSQVAGAWRESGSWAAVPQVLQSAGGPTTELKTGMKSAMRLTRTAAAARMMSLGRGRTLAAAAGRRLALSPTSPSSESSSKVPRGRPETSSERFTRAALLQEGCGRCRCPKGGRCRSASCVIADEPVVRCRLRSQEGDLRQVLNKKLCARVCYARHTLICPHTQRDPPRSRAAAVGPLSLKRTVEDQVVAEAVCGRTLIPRT